MAEVTLTIGGRRHIVACRDGEETHLLRLADMMDQRWDSATRAAGGPGGDRPMLFVALMLADALDEAEKRPAEVGESAALERVADRLEALASALEK